MREKFLVAGRRPAEQHQEVDQCPWQEAVLLVKLDGDNLTVGSFGNLGFLGVQGKGHMGKDRNGRAKCFVNENLPGGVSQTVLTADNMGDAVADIINHVTEQIERGAVGAYNDKVFNVPVGSFYAAVHLVFKNNRSVTIRHFETNDIGNILFFISLLFLRRKLQAGPVILVGDLGCYCSFSFSIKGFLCAETFIGMPGFYKLVGRLNMLINKVGLKIWSFIPVDTQPVEAIDDAINRVLGGTLNIGVLDPQDKGCVMFFGKKPIVNSGSGTADMKIAGRAWRKS